MPYKPTLGQIATGRFRTHPRYQECVGHWLFAEGGGLFVYDVSGRKNHGTLTGGPVWGASPSGFALDLNGTSQYVLLAPTILSTHHTLAAWIKTTTTTANSDIYSHSLAAGNFPHLGMHINDSTVGKVNYFARDTVNNILTSVKTVNDGIWHHIVMTRNVDLFSIYIDGVLDNSATFTCTADYDTATEDHFASYSSSTPNDWYAGTLDDFRIYARPLGEDDIKSLYLDPFLEFRELPKRKYVFLAPVIFPPRITMVSSAVARAANW